jgi:hypothetical protein
MIMHSGYKKIKKDYQRKNLQNPFFRKQAKESKPRGWLWRLVLIIIGLVLLIWLWLAAPWWRISQVEIKGLTLFPNSELTNIVWAQTTEKRAVFFQQGNLFLFNKTELSQKILGSYNFAAVKVEKKLPHTLLLTISERPYAFIFQEGSVLFYASADAYIVKERPVTEDSKKKYFILENRNKQSLINEKNQLSLSSNYLNFIFTLAELLKTKPGLPVERFIIDQEFNTVKVKIVNGPLVYFNVKDAVDTQVNYLLLVKREKIKDNFSKTNYIDLRYGDKIYINPDFK